MRRARPESDGFTSLALMNQLVNPPDPVAQAGLHGRPAVEAVRRFRSAAAWRARGEA
jgi:hypothetical protein